MCDKMIDEMAEFKTEDVIMKGIYTMNNRPAYDGRYV
jgi:hypothetical protein